MAIIGQTPTGTNAADANDLAHAQRQLARQKDAKGKAAWQGRIDSINNNTFDRSKIKTARPGGGGGPAIGTPVTGGPVTVAPAPVGTQGQPLTSQYIDAAFNTFSRFDAERKAKAQAELESKLVNSGNPMGSATWNNQMKEFENQWTEQADYNKNQALLTGSNLDLGFGGLNNENQMTAAQIQDMKANQGFKDRGLKLDAKSINQAWKIAQLQNRRSGAAPEPESPFATGLPPGYPTGGQ